MEASLGKSRSLLETFQLHSHRIGLSSGEWPRVLCPSPFPPRNHILSFLHLSVLFLCCWFGACSLFRRQPLFFLPREPVSFVDHGLWQKEKWLPTEKRTSAKP